MGDGSDLGVGVDVSPAVTGRCRYGRGSDAVSGCGAAVTIELKVILVRCGELAAARMVSTGVRRVAGEDRSDLELIGDRRESGLEALDEAFGERVPPEARDSEPGVIVPSATADIARGPKASTRWRIPRGGAQYATELCRSPGYALEHDAWGNTRVRSEAGHELPPSTVLTRSWRTAGTAQWRHRGGSTTSVVDATAGRWSRRRRGPRQLVGHDPRR